MLLASSPLSRPEAFTIPSLSRGRYLGAEGGWSRAR